MRAGMKVALVQRLILSVWSTDSSRRDGVVADVSLSKRTMSGRRGDGEEVVQDVEEGGKGDEERVRREQQAAKRASASPAYRTARSVPRISCSCRGATACRCRPRRRCCTGSRRRAYLPSAWWTVGMRGKPEPETMAEKKQRQNWNQTASSAAASPRSPWRSCSSRCWPCSPASSPPPCRASRPACPLSGRAARLSRLRVGRIRGGKRRLRGLVRLLLRARACLIARRTALKRTSRRCR